MVLIFAATIGKIIYDEVKDHRDKKTSSHKRSKSNSSQKGEPAINKPLPLTPLQIHNIEELVTERPTPWCQVSPVEGYYELDVEPPAYRAEIPAVPMRSPLRVRVGNDVVPWSPDDIVGNSEKSVKKEDSWRPKPAPQVFELE